MDMVDIVDLVDMAEMVDMVVMVLVEGQTNLANLFHRIFFDKVFPPDI